MDRPSFEARHGYVPCLRLRDGKRRSLVAHLANDPKYMERHGFIKIEKPVAPPLPTVQPDPVDEPVDLTVNQEFSPAREVPKPAAKKSKLKK
jgi:hypothetical protein